jgi:hypothetical protein
VKKEKITWKDIYGPQTDEKFLSHKEAAKFLGNTPGTLYVWNSTKRYDLQPIKKGRANKYKLSVLKEIKAARMTP